MIISSSSTSFQLYSALLLLVVAKFIHGFIPTASTELLTRTGTRNVAFIIIKNSNVALKRFSSLSEINEQNTNDSNNNDDDDKLGTISKPPADIVEGSQHELMYTLGVNLARQLGDITPLVDSGKELAQVAKGLLDTVVGRLSEDGQRNLLLRRGKDLNTLITERAYVLHYVKRYFF